MPENLSARNPRSRLKKIIRVLIYSLLAFGIADFFLIHPARITSTDLPPTPRELQELAGRLHQHVNYLASPELKGRRYGTPENKAAGKYLIDQFTEMGFSTPAPQNRRAQEVHPAIGDNVFSAIAPIDSSRKWIIVGAHFDHMGEHGNELFLGADDNASSVAILLEIARRLQQGPAMKQFNILLVGFNSEEPPHFLTHLMGSNQFVMRIHEVGIQRENIAFVVIMDLMGGVHWKPLQDSLFVMGAEKSPKLEALIPKIDISGLEVHPLGLHMVETIPGVGQTPFSDYDAFRDRQIPILFLSSGRTPHYHRSTDTAEKLHYARMARSVLWLEQLIHAVDALPEPLRFRPERENYVQDFKSIFPLVQGAARWRGKIPKTSWLSLYKLNRDLERMETLQGKIQSQMPLDASDGRTLSLASIRLQCLLGDTGLCAFLPGT